jgi:hypothetical protein
VAATARFLKDLGPGAMACSSHDRVTGRYVHSSQGTCADVSTVHQMDIL